MKRLLTIGLMAILMMLSCRTSIFAFDWKPFNAELLDQSENDSQKIVVLKDKQNRTFKVIYQDEAMLKKLSAPILKYKDVFYSWQSIHCKDITFMVLANLLDVVIVPQQFIHHNQNIAAAIPAGITMTYDPDLNLMRYDFRIMSGDQFVRISGNYSQEDELANKIGLAYDDPQAYLQPTVPAASEPVDSETMNEKMVQALIYLNDEDWNGRQKTIPLETIHKVVKVKEANPAMTKAELWKLVRKEKVKITKRQFELILILYFNEFK
ncbi:MAG TPA: hypothetical protein DDW50_09365 [Firmicutes bacterium]|jgi:hypothetical protein|nr:hypothetical protein [Bacillota bacterium]